MSWIWQCFCILVGAWIFFITDAVPYRNDFWTPSETYSAEDVNSESSENTGVRNEVRKKQEKEEDRDEYNNYVDFTGNISTYEKYLGPLGDNQDYSEAGPVESDLIYNDYPDGHRLSPKQVNNDENNDLSYQPHEDGDGERMQGRGFFGDLYTSVKNAAASALAFITGNSSPSDPDDANSSDYNSSTTSGPLFLTGSQLMKMRKDKRPIWERLKDGPVSGLTVNGQTFTFTRAQDYVPPIQPSYLGGTFGVVNGSGLTRIDETTPASEYVLPPPPVSDEEADLS
ncbi:hypothetical protein Fcan01_06730 [Folsomia candida]|uniref:Uncharacterized protein n=1 Tax=Folsomia candida TaxID=158441 RepID=A0A226EPU5_FOLCA|nr:hypothetical protein Fcan01_06730 [Folsomia candida]